MRFLASVLKDSPFGVQIKVVDALLEPRGISPSSALEGNPFGVVAALLQPRGLTGHFVVSLLGARGHGDGPSGNSEDARPGGDS